ncbi:MAG: carbon-nitrogen hydrolase family protein [Deltaproteobacteria bacterium]|nr:carbon-nitrogen hydrolase family protein [Deltaproteobacteria bacterium]
MRATVCELPDAPGELEEAWRALVAHCRSARSELVLLPELPFHPWFGGAPAFDPAVWEAAVEAHARWIERLVELAPAAVLATAPAVRGGQRVNEAFVWEAGSGYRPAHQKHHLPDEAGYFEARWYGRGDGRFEPAEAGPARIGFCVCTELWSLDRARAYGAAGVHLLATPRLTDRGGDRWLAGGRAAAIYAGAYSLSSNRSSATHGGMGWVVDPDGAVLAVTGPDAPFATVDVDLSMAEAAKATYPRYTFDPLPAR